MHIDHNTDNSYVGLLCTVLCALVTFADVETTAKIIASIATTVAASVTIYYAIKNNRKK